MSVVIKSNSLYTGSLLLPTAEQISTTPTLVYNAFASRVTADGGTIVNETKVRKAIDFIFENNLFGRLGVCASPHYAKKLDANGGVLKLYSITGVDLVGLTINSGTLPKITADNFVDFNESVTADNTGGILTTETKRAWSDTGRFAVAVATKENVNTGSSPIFDMSTHGETTLNADVFSLHTYTANSGAVAWRINNTTYGGGFTSLITFSINNAKNGAFLFFYDLYKQKASLLIHGIVQSTTSAAFTAPSEIYKNQHYLDFGGTSRATTKIVSGVKMSAMWFMSDVTDSQAAKINQFHETEYL